MYYVITDWHSFQSNWVNANWSLSFNKNAIKTIIQMETNMLHGAWVCLIKKKKKSI